ncbi:hypothetical protein CRYUN_Cryun16bG0007300 [Craigia yunnanensis]
MTEKIQEKAGVFIQPKVDFTYVLSITFPQPTIRIKIPKVLVKAMQKRNQTSSGNDDKGSKTKKKYLGASKKSFRKKVGSMFSNVFGKKKSPETDSKGENGEVHTNGDDEEMKKLKNLTERFDMGSTKITGKSTTEDNLNDGVQPMAVGTDEGKERPIVKEMAKAGDGRMERPKSRRTFTKRNDLELDKGKINNVDDGTVGNNTDSSVSRIGDKGPNTVGTKEIVSLKPVENSNDLPRFRSNTQSSHGKSKIAWSMKKMSSVLVGGKSEKQELCNKRILMGVRCRPLNHSGIIQYDENGVLLP